MAPSDTVLERFSLHLASALSSLQQSAQGREINRAVSRGPLSKVQRSKLDIALHEMALEIAQNITENFVERLMQKSTTDSVDEEPPIDFTDKWISQGP